MRKENIGWKAMNLIFLLKISSVLTGVIIMVKFDWSLNNSSHERKEFPQAPPGSWKGLFWSMEESEVDDKQIIPFVNEMKTVDLVGDKLVWKN